MTLWAREWLIYTLLEGEYALLAVVMATGENLWLSALHMTDGTYYPFQVLHSLFYNTTSTLSHGKSFALHWTITDLKKHKINTKYLLRMRG
jgi:hypothetical protein